MRIDRLRMYRPYATPLLLMGGIFLLSSIPGKVDGRSLKLLIDFDPRLQNLLHIPMFGLLQFLWLRAFAQAGKYDGKSMLISIVISVAYGIFDEVHQLLVPGRYASLSDVALNVAGVVLGTLVFRSVARFPCLATTK